MPAKQGKSPKVRRAGQSRRVVADAKPVHRTGGRKPQPQMITSPTRVQAICKKVQAEASEFLKLRSIEETVAMQIQIDFWSGTSDLEPSKELVGDDLKNARDAFFWGCTLVPDSAAAWVGPRLAVRGRREPFFETMLKEQAQQKEAARQARSNNRRNHAPRALQNGMSQQLVASGHVASAERVKQTNRERIAAVAAASSKS